MCWFGVCIHCVRMTTIKLILPFSTQYTIPEMAYLILTL